LRRPYPGAPRVPFPDSDEVGPGIGSLGKSRGAAFFARVWDWGYFPFPLSIRFFSTQNLNHFVLVLAVKALDLNQNEST
jgi:hypothetical protein